MAFVYARPAMQKSLSSDKHPVVSYDRFDGDCYADSAS